jgi:hypothetical protein
MLLATNVNLKARAPRTPVMRVVNQNTRGETFYKKIGILFNDRTILPLYGKPTYARSHMWNYYTVSNDHISVHIPVEFQGKDCNSNYGCREIDDDTDVFIPAYGETFKVKLYDQTPRYLPFV